MLFLKIYFNKAQLPKHVLSLLKTETNVYAQTTALEKFVDESQLQDVNVLLCLANLHLACAKSTDFEEDLIDFGNRAIEVLKQALIIEPANEEVKKDILLIQKKIRKAEKAAHQILKYEKKDISEIPFVYIEELAFYYFSRSSQSQEYAAKGYVYYKFLYEKRLQENPESENLLYEWHALTSCKFLSEGYHSAKSEIEQLIHWDLKPQFLIYKDYVTNGYWMKLFHYAETNELAHFKTLYEKWHAKMIPLEAKHKTYIAMSFKTLNPISKWLLNHEDTTTYLNYILENAYLFVDKNILTTEEKEIISLIQSRLT